MSEARQSDELALALVRHIKHRYLVASLLAVSHLVQRIA